jgi:hypothetical protein
MAEYELTHADVEYLKQNPIGPVGFPTYVPVQEEFIKLETLVKKPKQQEVYTMAAI